MIQKGTFLNVSDNSGAKKVCCLHIYKSRGNCAKIGDLILVSIKALRSSKRSKSKVKKGEIYKALIIRTKYFINKPRIINSCGFIGFSENSVVLLDKKNKTVGTRLMGPVLKQFKFTKYSRIISISSCLI
jgi:large subunit ribosomal protein L14